ncbi:thromboxane-A synthase-like isoform X2 [Dermacentor albipictus]|uniref:thromboxane-A synthase-like isoform X2 n=1 Tax=Dermacentor albipictus TaxID=60249 RepID=UPI0038FC3073
MRCILQSLSSDLGRGRAATIEEEENSCGSMDPTYALWQLVAASILLYLVHWYIKRKQHFNYFKDLGIPGPEPSIITGNIGELRKKTPSVAYREWIDKYGKVVGYFNGYRPYLLIADLDLLKMIQVKEFQDFMDRSLLFQCKRPPSPHDKSLIQLTGKRWKEVRSLLTPSFTTNKLKMLAPGVVCSVKEFEDKIAEYARSGEEFEIGELYEALSLDVICRSATGIDYNIQKNPKHSLLISSRLLFNDTFSWPLILLVSFPEMEFIMRYLFDWRLTRINNGVHPFEEVLKKCGNIVRQRQIDNSAPQKDLLQLMIEAKSSNVDVGSVTSAQLTAADDNEHELKQSAPPSANGLSCSSRVVLDDDDITQNAFLVLLAGYETTSNTLTLVSHMLVNYPEVQEKVRQELLAALGPDEEISYNTIQKLTYLDCVIQETMRLYPPIFGFVTREAVVDKQYGKLKIPAGTGVIAATEYMHRDPCSWEKPNTFDPDRFLPERRKSQNPLAFQPFGAGPRNCIGMRFAQMEMRFTLAHVLRKYRLEATPNSDKDPAEIEMNPLVTRIKKGVHVKVVPI